MANTLGCGPGNVGSIPTLTQICPYSIMANYAGFVVRRSVFDSLWGTTCIKLKSISSETLFDTYQTTYK